MSRLVPVLRHALIRPLLSIGLAAAVVSCAGGNSSVPQCEDGVDNDGDLLVDQADPACQAGASQESDDPTPACSDGVDNDDDGHTDYPADPGCTDADDTDEYNAGTPACSDGVDNDDDGKIDFPNDPGCLVPNQDSEADDCPDGSGCPACGNGVDDDDDQLVDYPNDPGCTSASDNDEFSLDPNACGTGTSVSMLPMSGIVSGTLNAGTGNQSTTCGGSTTIGTGAEVAYALTVDRPVTMVASTDGGNTNFDTVLYVRQTCDSPQSELACSDNLSSSNTRSTVTVDLTPGTYYVVVDGKTPSTVGFFTLTVNLYVGAGESCTNQNQCAPGYQCRVPYGGSEMSCQLPVCDDGLDDDQDGVADYPGDPGCTSPSDDTEEDDCPSGTNCPACANGVDDDMDQLTDYPDDPSCTAASSTSEEDCPVELDPLGQIVAGTTTGTTTGATNQFSSTTCQGSTGAPDRVFMLYVREPLASLQVDTNDSGFDTVLTIRDAVCAAELACDDDAGTPGTQSLITRTNWPVGSYAVVVDGYSSANGPFQLHVQGSYDVGAACDPTMPMFTCPTGYACTGALGSATCQPAACNDTFDADGDGFPGYPSDPGCTSTSDGDETDDCPDGPNCPQCGNGIDDDGDLLTDYPDDPGCVAASTTDEACITTDPVRDLTTATLTGQSTASLANDLDLSCGLDGRDEVFRVRITHPLTEIRVDTIGSALDTVVALKSPSCGALDLQCDDNGAGSGDSLVFLVDPTPGDYFIVVDDRNVANPGTYDLHVSGTYPDGGRCDPAHPIFRCGAGYTCGGTVGTETCVVAACNDLVDADQDGHPGYPSDPGCTDISDNDESDDCPSGPNCPACGNQLDDDMDGFTDYPADPACTAASTDSELAPCTSTDPVLVFTGDVVGATTAGRSNDIDLSCGADGRDQIYRLFVSQPLVSLTVDTGGSDTNTAVAVRAATCNGADLQCRYNNFGNGDARVELSDLAVGEYFIVVDDLNTTTPTTYALNVRGTLDADTPCDPASVNFVCIDGYACNGPSGSETCVPAACNDTVDADMDGHDGYPDDPGCASISDDDETDDCPNGPNCPACANGDDDDNDQLTDYPADPGCAFAGSNSEVECPLESDPITVVTTSTYTGTTVGASNDHAPACASSNAPDRAYLLNLPVAVTTLRIDTDDSSLDTILLVRDAACTSVMACDDEGGALYGDSLITMSDVAPGGYLIVVDGWSSNQGTYNLHVLGEVAAGTDCTSPLFAGGVLACPAATACTGGICQ